MHVRAMASSNPASRFARAMKRRELAQAEIARELGIHRSLLNHIVKRRRRPTLSVAAKIEALTTRWGEPIRAAEWAA